MNDTDIIEAIERAFIWDYDVVDCIVYLANNMTDGEPYKEWLIDHCRCPRCGSNALSKSYVREIHTELEEQPVEAVFCGYVCDECGEVIE